MIRQFVNRYLRYNKSVTDEDRVKLGLTVSDFKRTRAPIPDEYPDVHVDLSVILRLTLTYHILGSTSRARLARMLGVEIRWAILDAYPSDTDDLKHTVFSTHSPQVFEFKEHDRGKTIYFRLCWVNTRGQKGPWSEVVSAIIP
jgi:hypothetical protein